MLVTVNGDASRVTYVDVGETSVNGMLLLSMWIDSALVGLTGTRDQLRDVVRKLAEAIDAQGN